MASNTLFSDTEEISLHSNFYPSSQPFIGKVVIQIPEEAVTDDVIIDAKKRTDIVENAPVLESRPQNLLHFEYDRIPKGVGKFVLKIFDPTWELEDKIIRAKGLLGFKFGYSDDEYAMSPLFVGKVSNYTIDFQMNGVIICLFGLTLGFELALVKKFSSVVGKKISDIVKEKAIAAGYDEDHIFIEATKDVLSRNSTENTDLSQNIFTQKGLSDIDFISDYLIAYARTEQDIGDYRLYTEQGNDGEFELHFHTPHYKIPGKESEKIKAFTQYKDPNSPVITFRPSWNMTATQFGGLGGSFQAIIDINSKEIVTNSSDLNKKPLIYDNSPNTVVEKASSDESDATKSPLVFKYTNFTAHESSQLGSQVDAEFAQQALGAVQGELEIHGTNKLKFMEKIAVIVYIPSSSNFGPNKKLVHWISGYYRINGLKDVITRGSFKTYISLISSGRTVAQDKVKEQT